MEYSYTGGTDFAGDYFTWIDGEAHVWRDGGWVPFDVASLVQSFMERGMSREFAYECAKMEVG